MKRPHPILKTVLWILFGILVFLLLCFIALPKILSTQKGKETIFNLINKTIPGKIQADCIDLNWFSGQRIEKFSLFDKQGKEVFRFDAFTTKETLFSALFHRWNLGETELKNPHLNLVETTEGQTNVREALGLKKKKEVSTQRKVSIPKFKGHILVTNGEMTFTPYRITPITLSQVNFEAKDNFSFFHLSAKTQQGTENGEMIATGDLSENFRVLTSIHKFPVTLIDQMGETTLFTTGIGSYLDLDLELEQTDEIITLKSKIVSPNLNGTLSGMTSEGKFHVDQGEIIFTVTPLFFKTFFKTKEWELANRPELKLNVEKLVLPLTLKKPKFRAIPFQGKVTLERLEMAHAKIGSFSLNHFEANMVAMGNLDIDYTALLQGKGEATNINGKVTIFPNNSVAFNSNFKAIPTDVLELVMSADYPYLHKILGDQFSLSLDGKYDKQNKGIDTNIALTTSKFALDGKVEGKTLEDLTAHLHGHLIMPPKLVPFLGPDPSMVVAANISYNDRNLVIPHLNIDLENPHLSVQAEGEIGKKGKPFDYKDTNLVINGRVIHLPIHNDSLEYKGTFVIDFEGKNNEALGKINLSTAPFGKQAVVASFTIKDLYKDNALQIDQADAYVSAKANHFPVAFADEILDKKVKLYPLLGPFLNLEVFANYSPKKENGHLWMMNLNGTGTGFSIDSAISLNGTCELTQSKPTIIHFEVTEDRLKYLRQLVFPSNIPSEFQLRHSSDLVLVIEKIHCSKMKDVTPKALFYEAGFTGAIDISPMDFINPRTKERLKFDHIHGGIVSENFSKALDFKLSSDIISTEVPENQRSGFSWSVEALNLFTKEGLINKEGMTLKGDLIFDLIPVRAVTEIFPIKQENKIQVQALLGNLVNARIYGEIAKLNGPMTVDIKSSNFNGIFPLMFTKDAVTLTKDVEADLTLTEEINRVLLKDVTPILISGAWSQHPIRVKIGAQGFYMHLKPFSLAGITIQNGVIDLGRIVVKNGGEILSLVTFLKAQAVSPEGLMEAWFTPIYFTLQNGVASYKRFDALLAGNIHIALWGRIDLIHDRVAMTLGIGADTLRQNLNLTGLTNELFQVPMNGSTSKLQIDWNNASTRMAVLVAKSSAGGLGSILGSILEQLTGVGGEPNPPPPSTFPFPWQ